jgi:hypothetical protein
LNANTGTNLTYQWQLNGLNVSGATSSTFSAFSSGTYTVVVIDGAGCIATSNAITVTILPVPNVNAGYIKCIRSYCILLGPRSD